MLVRCVWQENTIHCHSNSLLTVFFLILNKRLFFFLIKDCFCGLLPEVVQRSIKHTYHLFSLDAEYENTLTLWESCLYNRYQLCYLLFSIRAFIVNGDGCIRQMKSKFNWAWNKSVECESRLIIIFNQQAFGVGNVHRYDGDPKTKIWVMFLQFPMYLWQIESCWPRFRRTARYQIPRGFFKPLQRLWKFVTMVTKKITSTAEIEERLNF